MKRFLLVLLFATLCSCEYNDVTVMQAQAQAQASYDYSGCMFQVLANPADTFVLSDTAGKPREEKLSFIANEWYGCIVNVVPLGWTPGGREVLPDWLWIRCSWLDYADAKSYLEPFLEDDTTWRYRSWYVFPDVMDSLLLEADQDSSLVDVPVNMKNKMNKLVTRNVNKLL